MGFLYLESKLLVPFLKVFIIWPLERGKAPWGFGVLGFWGFGV